MRWAITQYASGEFKLKENCLSLVFGNRFVDKCLATIRILGPTQRLINNGRTRFSKYSIARVQLPSRQNLLHDSAMHVGQSNIASAVTKRESFVVDAQLVACRPRHRRSPLKNVTNVLQCSTTTSTKRSRTTFDFEFTFLGRGIHLEGSARGRLENPPSFVLG